MSELQKGKNNSFYGKKHSEEFKHRMSIRMSGEKNPNYGKIPSKETRSKISKANKGKNISIEHRRKISEALKGEKNGFYGKRHTEETKAKLRVARLNHDFPKKNTSIEVALQKELGDRKIIYETHVPVCGVCQPDIVFLDKMVAVFADGTYWHSREFRDGLVWERDRHQDKVLGESGWRVLRFWGHEINTDVSRCVDDVEAMLG